MEKINENYALITSNLKEVICDEQILKKIMAVRPLRMYWGTACTSRIHIGYFVPMLKIADCLKAGCDVQILIADLHAFLDNMKSSLQLIEYRAQYYEIIIRAILSSLNIDHSKLTFVKGSSYQLSKEYTLDVYKANSLLTLKDAQHAGAEVVKQTDNPIVNGLLYPTLQSLDEIYLKADIELGGIDQRKIFMHSRTILPKIGYKNKTGYLMTEMIPGLRFAKQTNNNEIDNKMSSSVLDSKIDLLDTRNQIKAKINKAYCLPTDIEDNCLLTLLEKLLFPLLKYRNQNFVINRDEKYGGPVEYTNIDDVKNDFLSEKLYPGDLKLGIIDVLDSLLMPIRNEFTSPERLKLLKNAYP